MRHASLPDGRGQQSANDCTQEFLPHRLQRTVRAIRSPTIQDTPFFPMTRTTISTTPPVYREPAYASSPQSGGPQPPTLVGRLVFGVSFLNFAAVLALLMLLCVVSEDWWFSLALSYLPRVPYLLPSVLLVIASLLVRRRMVWLNLLAALLVLGPVMGFRAPLAALSGGGTGETLTVISYNVQRGGESIEKILAELAGVAPDVIVLQEATGDMGPIKEYFSDWHIVHQGEYLVAARWPVTFKDACRTEAFGRATAILCEVDAPDGPFLVCDVHLTTARYGLAQLRPDSPITGQGVDVLDARQGLRESEALETFNFVADAGLEMPLLVMGDFNMPTSSSLFQKSWGNMTSAFDAAGTGYGYTSPCNTGKLWPGNTPWLRIDHILLSSHWGAQASWVGKTNGSDHRCIAAHVQRRQ